VDGYQMTLRAVRADGVEMDRVILRPPPRVAEGAAVNAASFLSNLAPGGLIAIFGQHLAANERTASSDPLPATLSDVSVDLNGTLLPLLYVSGSQINAQIPFGVRGPAALRVTTPNGTANASVLIGEVAPAIFSARIDGELRPAILHADGSLISKQSPAKPGERVIVLLTGLGEVNKSIAAGQSASAGSPLRVRAPVEIDLAGIVHASTTAALRPGLVGVYYVEFVVSSEILSGNHSLSIRCGEAISNSVILPVGS
jgi:uncharacterized protein (TIGR03437 family)